MNGPSGNKLDASNFPIRTGWTEKLDASNFWEPPPPGQQDSTTKGRFNRPFGFLGIGKMQGGRMPPPK